MSKLDDCVEKYATELVSKCGEKKVNMPLLRAVCKGCGPSLYRADASKVSTTDPKEMDRVKKNFLIKKLGLKDSAKLDEGIAEVGKMFGKGNRNKYRGMFYYLLVKKFRKSGVYK